MTSVVSKPTHQAARSYLFQRHPNGFGINPHKFAAAAHETGSSFDELMTFIGRLYAGGAQADTFRQQDLSAAAQSGA
jgi:hypothetical protein